MRYAFLFLGNLSQLQSLHPNEFITRGSGAASRGRRGLCVPILDIKTGSPDSNQYSTVLTQHRRWNSFMT